MEKIKLISHANLSPSPLNREVRGKIPPNDPDIAELAESILESGVIQPLIVFQHNSSYQIIVGERRYRAACLLGDKAPFLPCIVRDAMEEVDQLIFMGAENLRRKNLSILSEARYYQSLQQRGLSAGEIAQKLGVKRYTVLGRLRLLDLPQPVQDSIETQTIPASAEPHLRKLSSELQVEVSRKMAGRRLQDIKLVCQKLNGNDDKNGHSKSVSDNRKKGVSRLKQDNREMQKIIAALAAHLRKDSVILAECSEMMSHFSGSVLGIDDLQEMAHDRAEQIEMAINGVLEG